MRRKTTRQRELTNAQKDMLRDVSYRRAMRRGIPESAAAQMRHEPYATREDGQ